MANHMKNTKKNFGRGNQYSPMKNLSLDTTIKFSTSLKSCSTWKTMTLEAEISPSIWTLQYDLDLILDPNSVQPFNKLINTQVWWWRWKLKFLSSICHSCDKWRREDRGIFCSRLRLSLSLKMKCWWWIK